MEEKEVLVKVEGLSKKFCKDLKTSLWYGVKDLITNVRGNKNERTLRPKEFWAVRDINFELRRGECIGLIGHNGAGKSTLLKIINGLIKPDAGRVTIKGRVGALIELGAGFNPVLSGRENIYNNGAILGFTKKEIDKKVEEIIDFAEIREFIDMPVRNYSSGMKVRLGFAVAAQMEPDVLIIDEVLAVGDLGFVLKCYQTIDTLLPNTAIVFVSHSMPMISRVCNKIILMERGVSEYEGSDVGAAIDLYFSRFTDNEERLIFTDNSLELIKMNIENSEVRNGIPHLRWQEDLKMNLELKFKKPISVPEILLTICDKEQRPIALLKPNDNQSKIKELNGNLECYITHKRNQFSKGIYSVNLTVVTMDARTPLLRMNNILTFQVLYDREIFPPLLLSSEFESKS